MEEKFTIEEIRKYIEAQKNCGKDILYNLSVENIRKANDGRSIYDCKHFDECQGRNKCYHPLFSKGKCTGVCENYEKS